MQRMKNTSHKPISFPSSSFPFLPLQGFSCAFRLWPSLNAFNSSGEKVFGHCAFYSMPSFCLFKDRKTNEILVLGSVKIIADAVMRGDLNQLEDNFGIDLRSGKYQNWISVETT